MKIFLTLIFSCLVFLGINAQNYQWHSYWGSNTAGSDIAPVSMALDGNGNIYTASLFGGSAVQVLSTTLTSNSNSQRGDVVITKMDPSRNQLWQHILVSPSTASIRTATVSKIVVNKNNDLIAVGTFTDGVTFDASHSMTLNNTSGSAVLAGYVVRYNSSGVVQSMWQLPSDEMTIGNVTVDNDNNIIIAGTFSNFMSFNPNDLTAQVGSFPNVGQLYFAKYSSTGTLLWLKEQGGDQASPSCTFLNAYVKADTDGSIYLGGTFAGTANFITGTSLTSYAANQNMFLVKYSADGSPLWQKRIGGTANDQAVGVEVSPIGDVAVYGNYLSDSIYISGKTTFCNNGFYTTAGYGTLAKIGVFTFEKESGNYRWWYSYGAGSTGNTPGGSAGFIYSMVCNSEGVWYIGGSTNWRYGDISTYPNFKSKGGAATIIKYGVVLKDGTWVQHDTNGNSDQLYLLLNREGELCNIGRLGGRQQERIQDIAVTSDNKSLYLLTSVNIVADVAYTCVDNFWDSFTDIILAGTNNGGTRLNKYHYFQVYCPLSPIISTVSNVSAATSITGSSYTQPTWLGVTNIENFAGNFYSAIIAKYDFPDFSPKILPQFNVDQPYSQTFSLVSPKSAVTNIQSKKFYPLLIPGELDFSSNVLSGTLSTAEKQELGVIVIDSLENAGTIGTYYTEKTRGNSRNVRYLTLNNSITGLSQTKAAIATFYPTMCSETLNLKTEEENFSVQLCNMMGQVISTYKNQKTFSVKNLPAGIYFAYLRTENKKTCISKFIVTK